MKNFIYYFGYSNYPDETRSDTPFFEYAEHSAADLAKFKEFEVANTKVLFQMAPEN